MDKARFFIELIGYAGSALVVVSMLMTSVMKLRIINTIGSVIFMIYALIIRSYPTALMNAFLVGINVYQMLRLKNTVKTYEHVELAPGDSYLSYLLDYYGADIARYFPAFRDAVKQADLEWLVSCDGNPVGVVLGKKAGDCVDLLVDYTVPAFRDCSVGKYVYEKLKEAGYAKAVCSTDVPDHVSYLGKMGFAPGGDGVFEKTL